MESLESITYTFNSRITQDGGYAEYVILRREALVPISKDLDPAETAPLLCAGVTTFNSLRNVQGLNKGDLVAVSGLGGETPTARLNNIFS